MSRNSGRLRPQVKGPQRAARPTEGDAHASEPPDRLDAGGGSIGLLFGGVLTQALDWHWIFFVNVPIGIVTGLLAIRLIDRDAGIGLRAGEVGGALSLAVLATLSTSRASALARGGASSAAALTGGYHLAFAIAAGLVAAAVMVALVIVPHANAIAGLPDCRRDGAIRVR